MFPAKCPELESWQAFFADAAGPDQADTFERHLESCPACQELLDRTDECGEVMRIAVRRVAQTPLETTPLPLVNRLLTAAPSWSAAPVKPADLYFLTPDDRPELLGTLGAYEVEEVIGQGGMGVILKAFEPALHRHVAIKVLSPAVAGSALARQRFTREAKAAAAVSHDHIVTIHGVQEIEELPYLVMQYIAGESLQATLDRNERLPLEDIVRIGLETARGLAAAHAEGLIHRDIKPANLLLEGDLGRLRITDFGLARMSDEAPLTHAGVVAGTPEYMAPEQARGETVDARADLFSLGSVLYALCTGVPPFCGSTPLAVLHLVTQQVPRPIRALNPDIPAWLELFIARLMAKDLAERFQSAQEVADLLEGYRAHLRQPTSAPAPTLPPVPWDHCAEALVIQQRFPRWLWAALLLLLVGLGSAALLAAGAGDPPSEKKDSKDLHVSFKGMTEKPDCLEYIGPDCMEVVRFEPEGLRITTPPGFPGDHPSTGVTHFTEVKGDFEITTNFEVLHAPEPEEIQLEPGRWNAVRFTIDVALDSPHGDLAAFSRTVGPRKQGATMFIPYVSLWDEATHAPQRHVTSFPTTAKSGQLRLVRSGSELFFDAAEGASQEFQRLDQCPFSPGDVKEVRLLVGGGSPKGWLDVRVTDLHIRAASVPELAETSGGSNRSLLALGLLLLILLLGAVSFLGARLRRQHGRAGKQSFKTAPVPAEPVTADLEKVRFPCSNCGKELKTSKRFAGKKVRCPQCIQAVLVPTAEVKAS